MFQYLSSPYPSTTSWCNPVARPYQRYLERVFWENLLESQSNDLSLVYGVVARLEQDTREGRQFIFEEPSREGAPVAKLIFAKLKVVHVEVVRPDKRRLERRRESESTGKFVAEIRERRVACSISFSIELV